VIGLQEMPSLSSYGDWLVRVGASGGVEAMFELDEAVARTIIDRTAETLHPLTQEKPSK